MNAPPSTACKTQQPQQQLPLQILVLGKSSPSLQAVVDRLDQSGIRVLSCANLGDLPSGTHRFGVLLVAPPFADTDLGLEVLMHFHDRYPHCWRLLLTSKVDPTHLVKSVNHGHCEAILPSPCPQDTLLKHLMHGLDQAGDRQNDRPTDQRLNDAQGVIAELQDRLFQLERNSHLPLIIGGLAHELNNPLGAILGNAQHLQIKADDPESVIKRSQTIETATDRCIELIERLRSYAQPSIEPNIFIEAKDPIREALLLHRQNHPDSRLDAQLNDDLLAVMGAPNGLKECFKQIFDNAFFAHASTISFSSSIEGNKIAIRIDNDGETPDDNVIKNAVHPFFTTRSAAGAQGLGLSLASALLRKMAASITIDRRPNQAPGARITLLMPQPSTRTTAVFQKKAIKKTQPKILLIDDEPLITELITDILSDAQCDVTCCGCIGDSVKAIQQTTFDGVICDLHLPDGSGLEFLHLAMKEQPGIAQKIAITTGDPGDKELQAIAENIQCPVISKPFRVSDIHRALEQLLGNPLPANELT